MKNYPLCCYRVKRTYGFRKLPPDLVGQDMRISTCSITARNPPTGSPVNPPPVTAGATRSAPKSKAASTTPLLATQRALHSGCAGASATAEFVNPDVSRQRRDLPCEAHMREPSKDTVSHKAVSFFYVNSEKSNGRRLRMRPGAPVRRHAHFPGARHAP